MLPPVQVLFSASDDEPAFSDDDIKKWGLQRQKEKDHPVEDVYYNGFVLQNRNFNDYVNILTYHNTLPLALQNEEGDRVTIRHAAAVRHILTIRVKLFDIEEKVQLLTSKPPIMTLRGFMPLFVPGYTWSNLYKNAKTVDANESDVFARMTRRFRSTDDKLVDVETGEEVEMKEEVEDSPIQDVDSIVIVGDCKRVLHTDAKDQWTNDLPSTIKIVSDALSKNAKSNSRACLFLVDGIFMFLYSHAVDEVEVRAFVPSNKTLKVADCVHVEGPVMLALEPESFLRNVMVDIDDGFGLIDDASATEFEKNFVMLVQKHFDDWKSKPCARLFPSVCE